MAISKLLLDKGVKERVRDDGGIIYSTEARGLRTIAYVADRMAPAEKKAQEEATRVVRSQPHRMGSTDRMSESPLGRFCKRTWPVRPGETIDDLNEEHRRDMHDAGTRFAGVIHKYRILKGLGCVSVNSAEFLSIPLTDKELKEAVRLANIDREEVEGVCRNTGDRALRAAMRTCVDELEPYCEDEGLLAQLLWRMAVHFSIIRFDRRFG